MRKAILTQDIVNTVLDMNVVMAPIGAEVTILEDNGSYYEVAYYNGSAPSTTFYVQADQLRIIHG